MQGEQGEQGDGGFVPTEGNKQPEHTLVQCDRLQTKSRSTQTIRGRVDDCVGTDLSCPACGTATVLPSLTSARC